MKNTPCIKMRFWLILEDIATENDTNVMDVFMRL